MSQWIYIATKPVVGNRFDGTLYGHRKYVITKTNRGKKCNFKECSHHEAIQLVSRYATCGSDACKESVEPCLVSYKIEYCSVTRLAKYYWKGTHIVSDVEYQAKTTSTPNKFVLGDTEKTFVDTLIRAGLPPKRIYHECLNGTEVTNKPSLKWLQNYVNFERSNQRDLELSAICNQIKLLDRKENPASTEPFVIGVDFEGGEPVIGNGSDMDPFVVGISSVGLLAKMRRFQITNQSAMFHIDATYKITKESYPLLVLGITDIARKFHLLGLFITSQTTEIIVKHCVLSLLKTAQSFFPEMNDWKPTYTMSDADPALHNALRSCFGNSTRYLNCYFHVRKNLRDMERSFSGSDYTMIMNDINSLHYSRTEADFNILKSDLDRKWRGQNLGGFADYVQSNLLREPFDKWQCYHSPSGYAKTNNPIENFNGDFKRTYTQRKKFHILEAINLICSAVRTETTIGEAMPVSTLPGRRKSFERIGKEHYRKGSYSVRPLQSNKFILEKLTETNVAETNAEDSEEEDTNSRYIEEGRCNCDAFFKFGHCFHMVILQEHLGVDTGRLVNRTVRRPTGARRGRGRDRRGTAGLSRLAHAVNSQMHTRGSRGRPRIRPIVQDIERRPRGRPRRVGPALSFE
jgi:hypothetical protein